MYTPSKGFQNSQTGKIIFISTIAATIYWILGKSTNVYRYPIGGAIFELLWLPSLIVLCILPLVSFILWVKERFKLRSVNFYSLVLAVVTVLVMMLLSK